ncbi:protein prune [Tripterygium wilfordii]|uniref:Protein prune n=1 Tax=Tripterygium wilfordii TaxID=458696 RepID=A0A7J7CHS7_TRIWF|nr:protein prune homolog 2-like [Tripterygium wilfordii]XP_038679047.1 protein prune homolog 2-like [Tripterygium wilfordii]KAF5733598.1 protein prune [Tripterygium wilfordii]
MRSPQAITQEPYIRNRESPYFDGLLRDDGNFRDRATTLGSQGHASVRNISRSASDMSVIIHKNPASEVSENDTGSLLEDSVSDIVIETFGMSPLRPWSKIVKSNSFAVPNVKLNLSFDLDEMSDSTKGFSPRSFKVTAEKTTLTGTVRPFIEKSYSVNKRKATLSKIPLPQSAASFYDGHSLEMEIVESSESIRRLNSYLKARRDDVNSGVPGRFLHAVIGQDIADVGSVASVIMYAFYLSETLENEQFCTVPVINIKRAELYSHAELKWLLDSCQIDQSSLIFIDEIDLSYFDLFGSLKLVLLNGHKLPTKQEALKEAVTEIFNCRMEEPSYPWVEIVTVGEDCSCCTMVAEKFAQNSPEILVGKGFSRLLLAGILLDTGNLTSPHCKSKDKYMATLLINGAGRFGCNGLHQILKYKMYDVADLKVGDILRKDFKKWTTGGKPETAGSRFAASHMGMSSIGTSIKQLLTHEDTSRREIKYLQQFERLQLLVIVSGYYDLLKKFKREILISAESVELMDNLLFFFSAHASQLPLKAIYELGLKNEMRAFEINKVTSRKTIEHLLEKFAGATSTSYAGSS